jgi:pyruvate,water dikinase
VPDASSELDEPAGDTATGWTDPLHAASRPDVHWTRANAEEIFPAAITHLTWSLVGEPGEVGWRQSFYDAGIFTKRQCARPDDMSERAWSVFYGRPAFNFDYLKYFAFAAFSSTDRDADATALRHNERAYARVRRWTKTAWSVSLLPRRLGVLRRETDAWWRAGVNADAIGDPLTAARFLDEAKTRYRKASRLHVLNSVMPVAWSYAKVGGLLRQAGLPDITPTVLGGFRSLEEVRMAQALWEVSRGQRTMADFLSNFGFRGPVESETSSRSWREDPAPLEHVLDEMRRSDPRHEPAMAEGRRQVEGSDALRALRARLPAAAGLWALVVVAVGRRYVPRRQVGKVSLVQVFDVTRACARALGRELHRRGRLSDPEGVFFLTIDELVDEARGGADDGSLDGLVEWRRERRRAYLALEIPRDFYGVPQPEGRREAPRMADPRPDRLHGQGVSAGTVEGVARVVRSAADTIDAGEILVCEFTDPGWTPLLVVAGGVVLDVGGLMSHGAIIARELGIPCVLGTGSATRQIRTGDRVRVDGDNGIVEILEVLEETTGTP